MRWWSKRKANKAAKKDVGSGSEHSSEEENKVPEEDLSEIWELLEENKRDLAEYKEVAAKAKKSTAELEAARANTRRLEQEYKKAVKTDATKLTDRALRKQNQPFEIL